MHAYACWQPGIRGREAVLVGKNTDVSGFCCGGTSSSVAFICSFICCSGSKQASGLRLVSNTTHQLVSSEMGNQAGQGSSKV